jgi:hypothetical protein
MKPFNESVETFLSLMADIEKDISKTFKNLIKVHVMTSEHSVEKY